VFATLVFDSFVSAGALVGVRSLSVTARHLLYQSSQLAIDVLVENQNRSTTAIIGQILETGTEPPAPRLWNVTLMQATETVAQTAANEFGEFYFECDTANDLRFCIEAEGEQPFMLILPD
jgi:hypothetical protein